MSYYSDDESVDIRVKRYHSPSPRYAPPRERPHSYYQTGVPFLNGERTLITTHERSRERSRERRSPPTSSANAPVAAPVVIHNKIVNEQSSDDDYYSDDSHHHRRHRSSHGRSHSRSHYSRPSSPGAVELARDQWELERARRELEAIRLEQSRERDERRLDKQYREEAELHRAKRDLDEIRRREARDADEKRIRKEIELKQLEEERRAAQEKKRREKEAEAAVAKYKAEEAERAIKQKAERERAEKEYQRRMQEDLIHAGVDEKDIEAILKREKIKRDDERKRVEGEMQVGRPTYTRMSLQYLDIETLLFHKIEFEYDQEPGYVLVKRWVPEWEQDMLWEHTRKIRIMRGKEKSDHQVLLSIDDGKKHRRHRSKDDDGFMWVHKKTERKRSKSPGLLMYLAGGRP